jgi:preprotein translocase subunit SecF
MTQSRNINFIGQSNLFVTISAVLVLASWVLVAQGGLKLGIDFAGGTEALVSFPSAVKVTDQKLKTVAESIGLENPEIVNYTF